MIRNLQNFILGIKRVLESGNLCGEVVVIGTPAEEEGGGKIQMLDVFKGCDICMMVHPSPHDILDPVLLAISQFRLVYHGKYGLGPTDS